MAKKEKDKRKEVLKLLHAQKIRDVKEICRCWLPTLYLLYQPGDFLIGNGVLSGLVVYGEEGDDPFFHTDDGCVGDDPCAVALAFAFVADGHAHFVHAIAQVGAYRGVLPQLAEEFFKVLLQ